MDWNMNITENSTTIMPTIPILTASMKIFAIALNFSAIITTQSSLRTAISTFSSSPTSSNTLAASIINFDNEYNNNNFNNISSYNYSNSISHFIMNNNNNITFQKDIHTCPSVQMHVGNVISMILYTIVCIIGLFGNTLVIYVVVRFSKMHTVTNMYILNLAIADECFLIGIPFLITTMHLGEWTFGKTMCKAYMVSTSITQFTSSIFLFIMSADRYIAVCHPISSPNFRTTFVSKAVASIAWTASALIMLPVMLYANTIEKDNKKISCIIDWPEDEHESGSGTTFIFYSLFLGFALPLSLILSFYYLVIRKLRTVGPKTRSKEKKRSHKKVTKLVLTVITVYVLCWLPYWISQVALIRQPPDICKSRLEITVFVLVGCLGYSNSAMNPILYAFLSDNFKKSFLKACTCAAGKDLNNQLQIENSFFPKFGKSRNGSDRLISSTRTQNNLKHITNMESATMVDATTITMTTKNPTPSTGGLLISNNTEKPPVLHTDL